MKDQSFTAAASALLGAVNAAVKQILTFRDHRPVTRQTKKIGRGKTKFARLRSLPDNGREFLLDSSKPIDQCELSEFWRGELHLELALLESLEEILKRI